MYLLCFKLKCLIDLLSREMEYQSTKVVDESILSTYEVRRHTRHNAEVDYVNFQSADHVLQLIGADIVIENVSV